MKFSVAQKNNERCWFWKIESDEMSDFCFYFPTWNPSELKDIYLMSCDEQKKD